MCDIDCLNMELLHLRRSTYMDNLRKIIPEPQSAAKPEVGLARWQRTPLDTRLPLIPGPLDLVLVRRKLGQPLRIPSGRGDAESGNFDTSDPYNLEAPLSYEALHDPHLTSFFRRTPVVQEVMIKTGLLTRDLGVKCTLREYNDYRAYLRKVHAKAIRRDLYRRDELNREYRILEAARKQALSEPERLRREERRARLVAGLARQREIKSRKLIDKWQKDTERLYRKGELQAQARANRAAELASKRERIQKRLTAAARREQQCLLNALKHAHEREVRLGRDLERLAAERRDARLAQTLKRFEIKRKEQEETVEKEARLKECIEEIKKTFIEEYARKVENSQRKLREIFLEKRKALEESLRLKKKKYKKRVTCCCQGKFK